MIARAVALARMFCLDLVMVVLILGINDPVMPARLRLEAAGPGMRRAMALWRLNHIRAMKRA